MWYCLEGRMHPFGCVSPRQGPKNWAISHQKALFQKFGPFRQPVYRSFSSYRIFPDLSSSKSESACKKLQIGSFSAKSVEKYCCSTKKTISVSTSHKVFSWRANAPFRVREPPAGPKKLSYISPDGTFPKNFVNFANLNASRSRATEFSWTSRFQNHNLHGLSSSWTAFHQDLTTGPRDIQVFVQKISEKAHALLKWICLAVVLIKNCSSTEKAISVSTSHVILSWKANAPFRVREPPAGPKKLRYIAPEGTFLKILSILPTLTPVVLELQNFPGPLAFRITIYMVLAPAGQLFIKIWPQGREIFKILCQNFWKIRMHFWSEFAPLLCQ